MNKQTNQSALSTVAFISVLIGVLGSLYFMFNVGRENKSVILTGLFTVWVSSPFVGLFMANGLLNHWKVRSRAPFYWLMLVLAVGSLIAYSGILIPPETKPAFIFLIFPLISWFLIMIVFLISQRVNRNDAERG